MIGPVIGSVISSVIRGVVGGIAGLPSGDFSPVGLLYYPEPIGGSTALERYQTNLDGQDDFWLRGEEWSANNAVIEIVFVGPEPSAGNKYLVDNSGVEIRAYCLLTGGTGFVDSSAATMELNGVIVANNSALPVVGEVNHVKLTYDLGEGFFAGVDTFGARLNIQEFFPAAINSIKLTDPASAANTYTYKLSGNAPYELPIGEELGVNDWDNNPSVIGSSWTNNGDGSFTCDGSQISNDLLRINGVLTGASGYFSGLEVVNYQDVAGGTTKRLRMSVGTTIVNATADGSYNGVTETAADLNIYITAEVGMSCTVRGVFAKTLPASALTFENGEPDGSDRELITRKSDNSGWTGDGLNEYDYAAGSNP